MLLGVYTGLLSMLLLVGLGLALWQGNRLAWAYVFYVATFQVYQLQSFGLGPAWVPFWPGPEHANLMQALGIALLVTGIGTIVTAFVQPTGWSRRLLLLVLTLAAAGPLVALWLPVAYRIGGILTILLVVLVLALLIQRLRDGESATRWFALGIAAMMLGAGIRSVGVAAQGGGMNGLLGFAFPVGNLIESTCWLIALTVRFSNERSAMLKQLRHDAVHDPLTGTFNRAYLREEIQTALNLVRAEPRRRFGLLFLDLDGFKLINDSLGHAMGDRVLAEVARTLVGLDLNSRAIGRFGGDEFLMLMEHDAHWSVTIGSASALVERFKEPLLVDGQLVPVRASVGVVAISPAHLDVDQVVRDADTALYVAKRDGGGRYKVFEPAMIKIDASVIDGIANLVKAQNLARGIVALGNELGCMVVAEGIETDQQLHTLSSMGCEYGQGFKLAAPMPGDEVAAWVALWQDDASRIARTAAPRQIH